MQGVIDAIKALSLGELFDGFVGFFQEQDSFLDELLGVFEQIGKVFAALGGGSIGE